MFQPLYILFYFLLFTFLFQSLSKISMEEKCYSFHLHPWQRPCCLFLINERYRFLPYGTSAILVFVQIQLPCHQDIVLIFRLTYIGIAYQQIQATIKVINLTTQQLFIFGKTVEIKFNIWKDFLLVLLHKVIIFFQYQLYLAWCF